MGHRLSKIYTRTGDDGTTGLADGTRLDKDDIRIEVFGTLDELNSAIGIVLSHNDLPLNISEILTQVQNILFDIGSEYCLPGYQVVDDTHVKQLELWLDELNNHLKPLKEFILPGGHSSAAQCHLARTICRRAERIVVHLTKSAEINWHNLHYLNRLSDLLFVIARYLNYHFNVKEPYWEHERVKKM